MTQRLHIALLIIFLASVSTWGYLPHFAPCTDCALSVSQLMNDIALGAKEAPFAYRILTPALLRGGIERIALFHFFGRMALFALTYAWVRRWDGNALASVATLTVLLSVMNATWYDSHYALTEAIILLCGWLILAQGESKTWHSAIYALLVAIGTLNREMTGILLVLSWLVVRRDWLALPLVVILGIITLGLQMSIDAQPSHFTPMHVLSANLGAWRLQNTLVFFALMLPLWIAILTRWRDMGQLNRWLWIALPYLGAYALFASWQEIRLLLPIYLLLCPMIGHNNFVARNNLAGVKKRV